MPKAGTTCSTQLLCKLFHKRLMTETVHKFDQRNLEPLILEVKTDGGDPVQHTDSCLCSNLWVWHTGSRALKGNCVI